MAGNSSDSEVIAIPRSAMRRVLISLGVVVLIIVVALIAAAIGRATAASDPLASGISSNEYQAVFLTNGQVFFGRLSVPGGDYYYLRHVYYLSSSAGTRGAQGSLTIRKLTNDVHGPEDLVIVSRPQVLYVENLNPNGRAAQILGR
jgi:hypothetical protein